MSYHYLMKFIIVGDSGVGKSCILKRFESDSFNDVNPATVGIEFVRKKVNIDEKSIMVQVWDTAGQESMFSLTAGYFKNSCGVILVFDVTNRASFEHLKRWLDQINNNANSSARRVLIGNKVDLDFQRMVSRADAEKFAKENNMPYIETSAKTAKNIYEMFNMLTLTVYTDIRENKIAIDEDGRYGVKRGELAEIPSNQSNPISLSRGSKDKNSSCCK